MGEQTVSSGGIAKDPIVKSRNFEFLRSQWPELAELAGLAEHHSYPDPASSLVKLRSFAERFVEFLYYHHGLTKPFQANLFDLLNDYTFKQAVPEVVLSKLHMLRLCGNGGAHGKKATTPDAFKAIRTGYDLGQWLYLSHGGPNVPPVPPFQTLRPEGLDDVSKQVQHEKKALKEQLEAQEAKYQQLLAEVEAYRTKVQHAEASTEELVAAKVMGQQVAESLHLDEDATRKTLIDVWLRAAGWDPSDPNQIGQEFQVLQPQLPSGKGYADYVLWGDNGKPLAVIEAKNTVKNPNVGRTQAKLYADGLEAMFGQRPIIFCTNGYEITLWNDGQDEPVRDLFGFYSKDSLEYLVFQSKNKDRVKDVGPDPAITDRIYQIKAVKQVIERFSAKYRKALIVQATGTGKTRVAISLCEALSRAKWARRVLFLCDRRELRKQADDAFQLFLPGEPRTVVNRSTYRDREHRIYLATYPAMMKVYETFDVGFFDLIIADESHRSIYNRYRELLLHFDALQVGLTATPIEFIGKSTFGLFQCEDRRPTANYSLTEAIEEQYLVPPKVISHTTAFLRGGIKYASLTKEQQRQIEEEEIDPATIEYEPQELDRKIFNKDTNRLILRNLMENGIKDETGSLVGKSIIFARNHNHAVLLEKLFDQLYPQYGSKVCRIIDNHDARAPELIEEFKDPKSSLRIAISVDMLDTGIDVPQVVNLVFAKPIFSYVKFRQMIGRGTRLCPDLFGPGEDKTHFLIIDHWGNFARFESIDDDRFEDAEPNRSKSLLQRLFESRIALAEAAREKHDDTVFDTAVGLIARDIADLPEGSISVREKWRQILEVKDENRLKAFDPVTKAILIQDAAPLMQWRETKGDQAGYEFDNLICQIQTEQVRGSDRLEALRDELLVRLNELPANLNQVRLQSGAIAQVRSPAFWEGATVEALEAVRKKLRGTMQYRVRPAKPLRLPKVIDLAEEASLVENRVHKVRLEGLDRASYRTRVQDVLERIAAEDATLLKIKAGQPVTEDDLRALTSLVLSQEPGLDLNDLVEYYPETAGHLDLAIRKIVGLDAEAVRKTFTQFIHRHPPTNSMQIQFLELLQNYIAKYGAIEVDRLYAEPFTTVNAEGLDGVFGDAQIDDLIAILETFQPPKTQGGEPR